jgi:hypothetical protein
MKMKMKMDSKMMVMKRDHHPFPSPSMYWPRGFTEVFPPNEGKNNAFSDREGKDWKERNEDEEEERIRIQHRNVLADRLKESSLWPSPSWDGA